MQKLIAGNWKMNGTLAEAKDLSQAVCSGLSEDPALLDKAEIVICPPFLHLSAVADALGASRMRPQLGAQDCSDHGNGAFTGQVSAEMLADFGCGFVILGHSERREWLQESDDLVSVKARMAHGKGLITIICVGETEAERDQGYAEARVKSQLEGSIPDCATADNTVIAYEPVWAIGTGKTATPGDVAVMHQFIRQHLEQGFADGGKMRILYGGSVKADNAAELLAVANVDGALVGGASLKADQFLKIAKAA